jgi:hypothetical protein
VGGTSSVPHAVIRQRAIDILDFLDHFGRLAQSALGARAYTAASLANVDKIVASRPSAITVGSHPSSAAVATSSFNSIHVNPLPAPSPSPSPPLVVPHPPAGNPPNPLDGLLGLLGDPANSPPPLHHQLSNGHARSSSLTNGIGNGSNGSSSNGFNGSNGGQFSTTATSSQPTIIPEVNRAVKKDPRTLKSPKGGKSRVRPPHSAPAQPSTISALPTAAPSFGTSSSLSSSSSSSNTSPTPPLRSMNISIQSSIGSGAPGTGTSPGGLVLSPPGHHNTLSPPGHNRTNSPTPFDIAAGLQFPPTLHRAGSMPPSFGGDSVPPRPSITRSKSGTEHLGGDPFAHLG